MNDFILNTKINNSLFHEINKIYDFNNLNKAKKIILNNKKFINFIKSCEKKIKNKKIKGIIISFSKDNSISPKLMTVITETVSNILGNLLPQNKDNEELIFVYDRNRNEFRA